jgi:hypothetical protein
MYPLVKNIKWQAVFLMPYQLLCIDVQRKGLKLSPGLASEHFFYAPLQHKASCPSDAPPSMKIGVQSYFQRIRYGIDGDTVKFAHYMKIKDGYWSENPDYRMICHVLLSVSYCTTLS